MSSEGQFTAFTRAIIQYFIITTFTGAFQQCHWVMRRTHKWCFKHKYRKSFTFIRHYFTCSMTWLTVGSGRIHTFVIIWMLLNWSGILRISEFLRILFLKYMYPFVSWATNGICHIFIKRNAHVNSKLDGKYVMQNNNSNRLTQYT